MIDALAPPPAGESTMGSSMGAGGLTAPRGAFAAILGEALGGAGTTAVPTGCGGVSGGGAENAEAEATADGLAALMAAVGTVLGDLVIAPPSPVAGGCSTTAEGDQGVSPGAAVTEVADHPASDVDADSAVSPAQGDDTGTAHVGRIEFADTSAPVADETAPIPRASATSAGDEGGTEALRAADSATMQARPGQERTTSPLADAARQTAGGGPDDAGVELLLAADVPLTVDGEDVPPERPPVQTGRLDEPAAPVDHGASRSPSMGSTRGEQGPAPVRASEHAALVNRITETVERLRDMAPPRQLTLELEHLGGMRLVVSLRADTVHLEMLSSPNGAMSGADWSRELSTALRERGFSLGGDARGGGGDAQARDQQQHSSATRPARRGASPRGWRL